MYDNPEDYVDTEKQKQKKQRRWCVKKALKLADIKSTEEKPTDMDSDEVVETAEKFEQFVKEKK